MNQFKTSTGFVLVDTPPRPCRPLWPNYLCVGACVVAATITLNPEAGQIWSQSASPTLASVDRLLAPWGAAIYQYATPKAPPAPQMIAVVLGCVQPDESVDELTREERLIEWDDAPNASDLKSITHPVNWRRPEGETSYRHDSGMPAD